MGNVVSCAPNRAGSLVTLVVYISRQAHGCKYVMKAVLSHLTHCDNLEELGKDPPYQLCNPGASLGNEECTVVCQER